MKSGAFIPNFNLALERGPSLFGALADLELVLCQCGISSDDSRSRVEAVPTGVVLMLQKINVREVSYIDRI